MGHHLIFALLYCDTTIKRMPPGKEVSHFKHGIAAVYFTGVLPPLPAATCWATTTSSLLASATLLGHHSPSPAAAAALAVGWWWLSVWSLRGGTGRRGSNQGKGKIRRRRKRSGVSKIFHVPWMPLLVFPKFPCSRWPSSSDLKSLQ